MENTTKALLIAASVLVTILVIALGITIFNSSGNTSSTAQSAGETISSATSSARVQTILSMIDYEDEKSFSDFIIKEYNGKQTKERVIELCKIVEERTRKLSGKTYDHDKTHLTSMGSESKVYVDTYTFKVYYNLEDNKLYNVYFEQSWNGGIKIPYVYSIRVKPAN